MGVKQRAWARKKWGELIEKLGGKCAVCGTTQKLSIDHVNGRDYESRKKSWDERVRTYLKEYEAGVPLRVLCRSHNSAAKPYLKAKEWKPEIPTEKVF